MWQPVAVTQDCEVMASGLIEGNQYVFRVMAENIVGIGPATELREHVAAKCQFGECG